MPLSYGEKKAIEWLKEQNPTRSMGTRARIAIVISVLALLGTVAIGLLPYIIGK
jgi:hypothetical protein